MSAVEQAVLWALNIANDNSHGYSQAVRWSPSYDCSSLVISAFQHAGIPVKDKGATYTGNMFSVFRNCGFVDVTNQVNLSSCKGMKRGDVLLNIANHTAIYLGNKQIVHARSSEGTTDTIDNSGNEIRTQSYYNYPWDKVLRYSESAGTTTSVPNKTITISVRQLQKGHDGNDVKMLQAMLNAKGNNCGIADGVFGDNTEKALISFQASNGLVADGIAGTLTFSKLLSK